MGTVGRPAVQKFHSTVATFDSDGSKRGVVVTTGRFADLAVEYAEWLRRSDGPWLVQFGANDERIAVAVQPRVSDGAGSIRVADPWTFRDRHRLFRVL